MEEILGLETNGSGVRETWTYECVVCHESVLTSSVLRRRAVMPDGVIVDTDAHEAVCREWRVIPNEDFQLFAGLSREERVRRLYSTEL